MKELDLWFDHRARHLLPVEYFHVSREPAVKSGVQEELIGVAKEWDRAMVENDAEAIGRYMAEDWTIIGPDGPVGDKATFLQLVKSGKLSHDVMESEDFNVRVYGETAVVTARGVSGGKFQGQAFREMERSSCVLSGKRGGGGAC
jgi:ketosteroid isomerase-like protein